MSDVTGDLEVVTPIDCNTGDSGFAAFRSKRVVAGGVPDRHVAQAAAAHDDEVPK